MKKNLISEEYKSKEIFYEGKYLKISLYYTTGTKKEAKGYYITFEYYIGKDITASLYCIRTRIMESGFKSIKHKEQACIMFDNVVSNINQFFPYVKEHRKEEIDFEKLYLDILY